MKVEREIAADAQRLWSLVSDLERWDELLPTVQQITRIGPEGPIGVGTRFAVRQPGLPKAVYEVTDWRPGRGFTWVASAGGVRTTASHEVLEAGRSTDGASGCRLVLKLTWSGPLAGLVRLLLGAKAQRMVEQEAASFAELAEGRSEGAAPADA
jgi:carbon monoxide dehydrogenase subunit G